MVNKEVTYLHKKFGVMVEGKSKNGFKSEEISAVASEVKADLIVMGMRGSGKHKGIGSTTLSTMRKTNVPIIVVPEGVDFTPVKNITFATDYKEKTM
jgi:nucleotide-binding universal stress UspA family protein